MKFRDYLIHKLGGCTQAEKSAKRAQGYKAGYDFAYAEIHEYMKELNGLSTQEWCDSLWNHVDAKRQRDSQ